MGDINTESINQEHKPFLKHPLNASVKQKHLHNFKAGRASRCYKQTPQITLHPSVV